MVKIHGVMVCWFVGLFQNSGNSGTQKKRPQRVFTIVDKCLQSVSFGNLLAFQTAMICVSKFCNSVGPQKVACFPTNNSFPVWSLGPKNQHGPCKKHPPGWKGGNIYQPTKFLKVISRFFFFRWVGVSHHKSWGEVEAQPAHRRLKRAATRPPGVENGSSATRSVAFNRAATGLRWDAQWWWW